MEPIAPSNNLPPFAIYLRRARLDRGFSQATVGKMTGLSRLRIVRLEAGTTSPSLDEVTKIATYFKLPYEYFVSGGEMPASDLQGISFELYQYGIRDLWVEGARPPGAFRPPEQILVYALAGDRPDARVVLAIPYLLAYTSIRASVLRGLAKSHDQRVITRVGWLADITLAMSKKAGFPRRTLRLLSLQRLVRIGIKMASPDSFGYVGGEIRNPIWLRWKVSHPSGIDEFFERFISIHDAYEFSSRLREPVR